MWTVCHKVKGVLFAGGPACSLVELAVAPAILYRDGFFNVKVKWTFKLLLLIRAGRMLFKQKQSKGQKRHTSPRLSTILSFISIFIKPANIILKQQRYRRASRILL